MFIVMNADVGLGVTARQAAACRGSCNATTNGTAAVITAPKSGSLSKGKHVDDRDLREST
jgi:hypothetical protein